MLDDMLITVDILKYAAQTEYEGWLYCYVHEFDRIIYSNFSSWGNPTIFYFLNMGYKKNIKIRLSLDGDTSDLILLKDEAQDSIITNLHTYEIQIVGTFIGYKEENKEKIAMIKSKDFIFKISSLNDENYLNIGQKFYFKSLLTISPYDEFQNKIRELYKNVRLSFEELESWPKDKTLWPDPELKLEEGESPLEELISNDPEYVKRKLGREHCNDYLITSKAPSSNLLDKIDEEDLKYIEHLIQK